jgi:hypothetical protein
LVSFRQNGATGLARYKEEIWWVANKMAPPVLHATAKIFGELFNKGATRLSHFAHYKEDILSSWKQKNPPFLAWISHAGFVSALEKVFVRLVDVNTLVPKNPLIK